MVENKSYNEILQENCEQINPSGWNIYKWASEHPETTIAASIKRIEKIFDFSSALQLGFSGGKDSSVSANLACLELNLRRLRLKYGVDRDGNPGIDPLDKKWENKRLHMAMTDAEVVFTFTNNYAKRFLQQMGPKGFDLIEFNWICLPLAWQSGVSFDSGILISWDKDKENIWVQPMPTKEELFGFDCLNEDNLNSANPVALISLKEEAQKYHRENNNVIKVKSCDLFNGGDENSQELVDAVCNFGRGPITFVKKGMHEKEEQDEYSYWFYSTSWLVSECNSKEIKEAMMKRHDLKNDVWFLKGDEHNCVSTALISLRAEESLDRRVILSQGEYSTGQYSNNQGVNICSPVFDYTTNDVWRLISAADWDINEVYEKLYEIGVGIADQRVGSLLNYAAVRSISTVKALEPDLYGRINGRFQNVEFMAQFSRAGYFRIGKPKDTMWDGHNHIKAGREPEEISSLSDEYERLLNVLNVPYERYNDNEFRTTAPKLKGKPWFPLKGAENNKDLSTEDIESIKNLQIIHTTWRDYTLMLLNSTPDPLRSIWREKVASSVSHWNFNVGSISEGNLAGIELLSVLPNWLTEEVVGDYFEPDMWYKDGRLAGSKRMKIFLGHYPQESLSNEANLCVQYIIDNFEQHGYLIQEIPLLKRIWDLAQDSGGLCVLPDEVLTYTLEKPINDKDYGGWIDVAYDVFQNGPPSDLYGKYWRATAIENFPLSIDPDIEVQKQNFVDVCNVMFKEDIGYSPCWKKIAICILKNDTSFKYAGFAPTLRERQAREEAIAAFSTKEQEKEKAKAEAQRLADQIAKEKEENPQ